MKKEKYDTIGLVMEPYVLDILHALSNPKRFTDLVEYVKNGRTLTLKLQADSFRSYRAPPYQARRKIRRFLHHLEEGKEHSGETGEDMTID